MGPQAGTVISDLHTAPQGTERLPRVSLHRGSLLRELVSRLPEDCLHTDKRVVWLKVLSDSNAVEVTFEDGESATYDAVIGADGIWDTVRSHVLDDVAEYTPVNAGWWDCRNLVPLDKAREVLGDKLLELDRAQGWPGDGGFTMHVVSIHCLLSSEYNQNIRLMLTRVPHDAGIPQPRNVHCKCARAEDDH